ncbi:dihydroorotate dehydrogenase (quinone), partial [Staphylococcus aureus]|nr:dihydroorotate dehydrogenase (quinone) [Staphylococcus aureus]
NISSPNTENLQNFHDKDEFSMLCQALTTFKKQHDVTVPIYLKLIKYAYQQTNGEFLIIGTGGVFSTEDAIKMMRHGASLIQIYSSLVIEGPGLTKKMNKGIARYLKDHHFDNVSDIIGLDA